MASEFTSIQHFNTTKQALRMHREVLSDRISHRWNLLQDRETRGILLRDAASDLLHAWEPYRKLSGLLKGKLDVGTLASLGTLYASTRPTWTKRLLYTGISNLIGKLFSNGEHAKDGSILDLIAKGVGMVQGLRRKKHAPSEEFND